MPRCLPWLLSSALLAAPALAHDADVIYANLEASRTGGALRETLTMTGSTLAQLAPIDADGDGVLSQADLDVRGAALKAGVWDDLSLTAQGLPCHRRGEAARLRDGFVELEAEFLCNDGELRQDFRFLRVLPANYRVVLGTQLDSGPSRAFAQGSLTSVSIARPGPVRAWTLAAAQLGLIEGLNGFFTLGVIAALGALGCSFRGWRRGLQGLLAVSAGAVSGALLPPSLTPAGPLALALTAIGCAWVRTEVPLTLVAGLGVALGLNAGSGAEALGAAAGVLALGLPLLLVATAVGQLLQRRRWSGPARWTLAVLTCFAAGVRALG